METSKIEQVESQVRDFDPDELRAFRIWFAEFDAEVWDQQIEADAKSGTLSKVADRALAEYEAGRTTLL